LVTSSGVAFELLLGEDWFASFGVVDGNNQRFCPAGTFEVNGDNFVVTGYVHLCDCRCDGTIFAAEG
jgi:hypothetical protein